MLWQHLFYVLQTLVTNVIYFPCFCDTQKCSWSCTQGSELGTMTRRGVRGLARRCSRRDIFNGRSPRVQIPAVCHSIDQESSARWPSEHGSIRAAHRPSDKYSCPMAGQVTATNSPSTARPITSAKSQWMDGDGDGCGMGYGLERIYSRSKNCPNVWLLWKDWCSINQINYIIIWR